VARYAAFLRGINLGRRRVTGDELCAPFGDVGLTDVHSFLASGNVVFTAGRRDEDGLRADLEAKLEERLGWPVLVFLRHEDELAEIVGRRPFGAAELAGSEGKPQVILLAATPDPRAAEEAVGLATDGDLLVLEGRELHWLPPAGLSTSQLPVPALERLVGPTTTRTANTLTRLHAKILG
jgi:uncharacterized protein (DUF1697 family)